MVSKNTASRRDDTICLAAIGRQSASPRGVKFLFDLFARIFSAPKGPGDRVARRRQFLVAGNIHTLGTVDVGAMHE